MAAKLNRNPTDAEYLRWLAEIDRNDGCELNADRLESIAAKLERLESVNAELLMVCKALLLDLTEHITQEAKRLGLPPEEICPCMTNDVQYAKAIITRAEK